MNIETIDMGEGFNEAEAIKSLRRAAQSHGFFFLKALSDDESSKMFETSKAFFALPEEVKKQESTDYTHGYLGPGWQRLDPGNQSVPDTKEGNTYAATQLALSWGKKAIAEYFERLLISRFQLFFCSFLCWT